MHAVNEQAQWRLNLAHAIHHRIESYGELAAVVVGGSVAHGFADEYSDLEIICFWHEPPLPQTRTAIKRAIGADFRYPPTHPAYESSLQVRGFPIDLWHISVAEYEVTMDRVLHEYSLDLLANNRLDIVRSCIPLRGQSLVQEWKSRVEQYPEELTIRFLTTYMPDFHLRQLELAARRNSPNCFHIISSIQERVFLVLLALNQTYFPTFKWMYQTIVLLPLVPIDCIARLRSMFYAPPLRATTELHNLLSEIVALVEAQYPQIDTTEIRAGMEQVPQPFSRPVLL